MRPGIHRLTIAILVCAVFPFSVRADDRTDQLARLQRRMEAFFNTHAQALIDEQTTLDQKADVALIVGAMVEMGMMGEPDLVKAARYYKMASEMGSADADCVLGNLHYGGADSESGRVDRDLDKALEYYHKAAAHDSVAAMLRLGEIYADGMGVEPDSKKALVHFINAAERGDEQAIRRLMPVMEKAREFEEKNPGKQANFPTSREQLVKPELAKAIRNRYANLEKLRSKIYIELNRRIAASTKE